jgi:hypothetical protein
MPAALGSLARVTMGALVSHTNANNIIHCANYGVMSLTQDQFRDPLGAPQMDWEALRSMTQN